MSQVHWPVPVSAIGGATAGTRVWKQRGQLYVTVVVKATLALVPDAAMTQVTPDPLDMDERPDLSGHGLSAGGDMAPSLAQAELWVIGHAQGIPTAERRALDIRIALARDSAFIYDKKLSLDTGGAVGSRVRLPLHRLGPLSRRWPVRARRLGGLDAALLAGPHIALPDAFDWEYFQTTPADQRLPALRGDEWLVLEGVYLDCPRLKTYLPRAVGMARLYGRDIALRQGRPLRIGLDSLHIDVDRRICSMLWRGYFPVSSQLDLSLCHVVGGVERPGVPLVWVDPFDIGPDLDSPLGSTFMFSEADALRLAQMAATPFEAKKTGLPPTGRMIAGQAPKAAEAKVDAPSPAGANPCEGTFQLSDTDAQRLAELAATPFEKRNIASPPRMPPEDPGTLGSTFQLSDADAEKLAQIAATPFEGGPKRKTAEIQVEEVRPSDPGPMGSTFLLSDADAQRLAEIAATPFEASKSSLTPLQAIGPLEETPASLGDIFLAAMAEAGTSGDVNRQESLR